MEETRTLSVVRQFVSTNANESGSTIKPERAEFILLEVSRQTSSAAGAISR